MKKYAKWIFLVMAFWGLSGCASLSHEKPAAPEPSPVSSANRVDVLSNIQHWDLKGLIAIRNARDAWSATWQWHQNKRNYTIGLQGPLGSGSMELTGTPGSVVLETGDGKKFTSTSPENLLEKQLGWRLPVSNLYYWIRGLPVPNVPTEKTLDAKGRLSVLAQQGWRIEYSRYLSVMGVDLPGNMILNNAALNVKLVIKQWQV
ncbi:MAG TPA: lipoprotein insertase outer membrane protein LolB [Gammaproteobacteria bacterium]|nr:lipoprotein insertase outer membrane protein LolB [Gammaproteobacteria bacterium]